MTVMITEMYDALKDAGASEEKSRKAAEVVADYDSRLASIDAKLSVALWAGGLMFAAILTSQAAIWIAQGRLDGHLSQIGSQVTHIEQVMAAAR
jgi:hypothetical protein